MAFGWCWVLVAARGLRVGELDVRVGDVARLRVSRIRDRRSGGHHAAARPRAPASATGRAGAGTCRRGYALRCARRAAAIDALRADPCGARLLRAFAPGDGVRLVGGAVRDLLLERAPRELDWWSRATSTPRPRAWAARSPRTTASGPRACAPTAAPSTSCAPAPRPTPHPGALPDVRPGTLDEDLRRRDVTVNAIALGLDGAAERGRRRARGPARPGCLRVLHDALLRRRPDARLARRALRGAPGLRRSRRTRARWPRAADPGDRERRPAGGRAAPGARRARPAAALQAVRELNPAYLPDGFDPRPRGLAAALAPAARRRPRRPAHARGLHAPGWTRARCSPGSTTWASSPPSATSWPRPRASRRARRCAPRARNAEIARAARGAPVEAVALAGGENARRWLEELRHVRLEINGDDLLRRRDPGGARDRRAAAAHAGPQARRRGRRARAGARRRARAGRRIGSPRDERQRAALGRRAGPLRGLLPLAHRSRAAATGLWIRYTMRSRR